MLRAKPELLGILAQVVVEILGDAYPSVRDNIGSVLTTLNTEVNKFHSALDKGQRRFYQLLKSGKTAVTPFELAQLSSSHGMPLEILEQMCKLEEVQFDLAQIQIEQEIHKLRSSGVKVAASQ